MSELEINGIVIPIESSDWSGMLLDYSPYYPVQYLTDGVATVEIPINTSHEVVKHFESVYYKLHLQEVMNKWWLKR
ncbi:MAG: hypothetical protein OQK29_06655 [Ignavibacteriaceae bacterium]|nr:hypothetical protein [Ignavibacteriaceae bacterium]